MSFNPRPPLLAGDAHHISQLRVLGIVSIRARHCWRAMQGFGVDAIKRSLFQSAPAIAGGRCRPVGSARFKLSGFNPRPPLLAGDA